MNAAPVLSVRIEEALALAPERIRKTFELFEIVETHDVETAAIGGDCQPVLEINPTWVAEHARTREKLLMLLLHEALHVLLGHTRLFPLVGPVDNVVLDAVINAMLSRLYADDSCTSLFTDFYDDGKFPECFLRPATHWTPGDLGGIPVALRADERRNAARVHKALYSEKSVPTADLYRVIPHVRIEVLLGNHGSGTGIGPEGKTAGGRTADRQKRDGRAPSPQVRQIVGEIGRTLAGQAGARGAGLADLLQQLQVEPVSPVRSDRDALIRILRSLGRTGLVPSLSSRRPGNDLVKVQTALPSADRRTIVLRALGTTPLLYASELLASSRPPRTERVHVYLDVSNSLASLRRPLYGAILAAKELVFPVVHLFSTRVEDVTLRELLAGVCKTTGGTSLEEVATHIEKNRVRRALVVTDGLVGTISGRAKSVLSKIRLGVALTHASNPSKELLELASIRTTLFGETRQRTKP